MAEPNKYLTLGKRLLAQHYCLQRRLLDEHQDLLSTANIRLEGECSLVRWLNESSISNGQYLLKCFISALDCGKTD